MIFLFFIDSVTNQTLKTFYKTFTGKNNFSSWNASGNKKFNDIPLIAYHETEACKDVDSPWQKSYTGSTSNPLFVKFADNIIFYNLADEDIL